MQVIEHIMTTTAYGGQLLSDGSKEVRIGDRPGIGLVTCGWRQGIRDGLWVSVFAGAHHAGLSFGAAVDTYTLRASFAFRGCAAFYGAVAEHTVVYRLGL